MDGAILCWRTRRVDQKGQSGFCSKGGPSCNPEWRAGGCRDAGTGARTEVVPVVWTADWQVQDVLHNSARLPMSLRSRWTVDPGRRPVGPPASLLGACRDSRHAVRRTFRTHPAALPDPPAIAALFVWDTGPGAPHGGRFPTVPCPPSELLLLSYRVRPSASGKILGIPEILLSYRIRAARGPDARSA